MDEIWRPIPSLPTHLASSLGRVMVKSGGKARTGMWATKRFKITRLGKTYKVHRLICEAFHGPAPSNKPLCMHLDENPRNNRPENLAWGTNKENLNAPGYLKYSRSRPRNEKNQYVSRGESSPSSQEEMLERLSHCETSLAIYDEGGCSEYWLRYHPPTSQEAKRG